MQEAHYGVTRVTQCFVVWLILMLILSLVLNLNITHHSEKVTFFIKEVFYERMLYKFRTGMFKRHNFWDNHLISNYIDKIHTTSVLFESYGNVFFSHLGCTPRKFTQCFRFRGRGTMMVWLGKYILKCVILWNKIMSFTHTHSQGKLRAELQTMSCIGDSRFYSKLGNSGGICLFDSSMTMTTSLHKWHLSNVRVTYLHAS